MLFVLFQVCKMRDGYSIGCLLVHFKIIPDSCWIIAGCGIIDLGYERKSESEAVSCARYNKVPKGWRRRRFTHSSSTPPPWPHGTVNALGVHLTEFSEFRKLVRLLNSATIFVPQFRILSNLMRLNQGVISLEAATTRRGFRYCLAVCYEPHY